MSHDADLMTGLHFARGLARDAGALALDWQARGSALRVEEKAPGDFVSAADRDVETFIRKRIAETFPGDAVLGEEEGGTMADRLWVIDPIDGTTNYLKGLPSWCVSIAFMVEGAYAIGVIEDPVHQVQYYGLRGHGAFRNGVPMAVSPVSSMANAHIAFAHYSGLPRGRSEAAFTALAGQGASFRDLGSGAIQLTYVAAGMMEGYFEASIRLWDVAAAFLLVEEAGGWTRGPFDPTNPSAAFPVTAGCPGIRAALDQATDHLFT